MAGGWAVGRTTWQGRWRGRWEDTSLSSPSSGRETSFLETGARNRKEPRPHQAQEPGRQCSHHGPVTAGSHFTHLSTLAPDL